MLRMPHFQSLRFLNFDLHEEKDDRHRSLSVDTDVMADSTDHGNQSKFVDGKGRFSFQIFICLEHNLSLSVLVLSIVFGLKALFMLKKTFIVGSPSISW